METLADLFRLGRSLDIATLLWVRRGVRRLGATQVEVAFHLLCRLADAVMWPVHALFVLVYSGFEWGPCLRLVFATILATLASQAIKRAVQRPRPRVTLPNLRPRFADPDGFSLPSGHAAATAAAATAAFMAHDPLTGAYVVFALLVGWGRVILGAHYPLDVLTGAIFGIAAGAVGQALVAAL